jgi:hypothetical protein
MDRCQVIDSGSKHWSSNIDPVPAIQYRLAGMFSNQFYLGSGPVCVVGGNSFQAKHRFVRTLFLAGAFSANEKVSFAILGCGFMGFNHRWYRRDVKRRYGPPRTRSSSGNICFHGAFHDGNSKKLHKKICSADLTYLLMVDQMTLSAPLLSKFR